jgi:hypothetical protein
MEKTVPTATFVELWKSRRPDFRAANEIRNLTRKGIEVEIVKKDQKEITLRAIAKSIEDIRYLHPRGYEHIPEKLEIKEPSDVVQTILARPRTGPGGGISLTRDEVAMLFLDGYAGDAPGLLDIRSQGYGDDDQWHGLTHDDVLAEPNTTFVWTKWEPLELWHNSSSHSDA